MRLAWTMGLTTAQIAALAITYFVPGFGAPVWSHVASLVLILGLTAAIWKPLQHRRLPAIGALATSVLAIVSGFYLLYWKEGIRADGYQDWGVWWHVAWSWGAAVFFFQHTWVNRVQYAHFIRNSFRNASGIVGHIGMYVLIFALFVASWIGRDAFSGSNYLLWTFATWLVVVVPAYILWLARVARTHEGVWQWRRGIDLALVPIAALATLSGIPLTFMDGLMDAAGLKYASKFWHVAPSIVFTVLVFAHSVQVWRTVTRHWQKIGR